MTKRHRNPPVVPVVTSQCYVDEFTFWLNQGIGKALTVDSVSAWLDQSIGVQFTYTGWVGQR